MPEAASRDYMMDHLEGEDFIADAAPCGPGVRFSYKGPGDHHLTALMENKGWYLANYDENEQKGVLMPIPEGRH